MTIETETQPQPRTVTLTMDADAVPVPGNRGDQWKLAVKLFQSDFASFLWIDRTVEPRQPLEGEAYQCAVSVKKLKAQPKDGSIRTGSSEWDWQWKIDQWNIDDGVEAADAPVSPTPRPSGQVKDNTTPDQHREAPGQRQPTEKRQVPGERPPTWEEQPMKADHPSKRRSIERQASLKAAIDYLEDKESTGDLLDVASLFYEWISAPPEPPQSPPKAPESVPEPVSTPPDVEGPDVAYDKDGEIQPIDTIEDFAETMGQWGVTREQVKGALGGKTLTEWIDGRHRTIGAALIRVKNNLGIESL